MDDTVVKYLIGDMVDGFGSFTIAITFPQYIGHNTMARQLFVEGTVVSGGFFYIEEGRVMVYGKSDSMKVESRKGIDERIICKSIGIEYPPE